MAYLIITNTQFLVIHTPEGLGITSIYHPNYFNSIFILK